MSIWELIGYLLPIVESAVRGFREAIARGRDPGELCDMIIDHISELPAKIRAA